MGRTALMTLAERDLVSVYEDEVEEGAGERCSGASEDLHEPTG